MEGKSILMGTVAELQNVPKDTAPDRLGVHETGKAAGGAAQ